MREIKIFFQNEEIEAINPFLLNLTPKLNTLSNKEIEHQIVDVKKPLEEKIGKEIITFAYPYGIFNETSKKIVKELGFNYGIATDSGKFYIEDDLYQVRRIGIFSDITMSKFKRRVKGNYNLKYTK